MAKPKVKAPKAAASAGAVGCFKGASVVNLALLGLILLLTPISIHVLYTQWDRSFLRAPVCREHAPSGKGLPKLVMFLGPEGGGHDLFEYIFSALPTHVALERFDPDFHLTASPLQETSPADKLKPHMSFCPKLPYARRVHDFGVHVSNVIKEKAPGPEYAYVRVRDPLPMGRVRTPLARPDAVAIGAFHGLYYDLKVIVLVRNLTKSVMWSITRNFHNEDVGLQLRLVEGSLAYLDASVRALPCGTFALVNVDSIQDNAPYVAGQLATFLDLPKVGKTELQVAIQVALSRWGDGAPGVSGGNTPFPKAEPTFGGQKLEFFFSQRKPLWPLIEASRSYSVFLPSSPLSWPR